MLFFWTKATNSAAVISAKLERLRESERALIELAFEQKNSSIKGANPLPPIIEPFDTHIPVSCLHYSNVISYTAGTELSNLDQNFDELYRIHGISITSQNGHENLNRCDKPLVLLHGYSKYSIERFVHLDESDS
jgi:hypothetical protein